MDEDKIIGTRYGGIGAPSSPDDIYIGVTRDGHNVYQRKDGTRYTVYEPALKTIYTAKYNPNNTDWYNTGNIATDENGRRFYGNTPEEAQQKYEAWKQQKLQEQGAWSTIDMINAMTGGIVNQLSPTQFGRNIYNMATGNPDFARQFVYGNNGLVSDEFAANHPWLSLGINLTGDAVTLGGPSAVRNVGRAVVRSVKPVAENMKQVVDNARNYANYLSRVAAYNNRGRLNAGIPVPNFEVTEDVAQTALGNVKNALANGDLINPSDLRILSTKMGQSVVLKEGNEEILSLVANNLKHPKVQLLNKVYTGELDPSDITAIVEDDQLLSKLPDDTRNALIEAYDDALYQSLANAENRVEAAKGILPKLKGEKYKTQILDELASTRSIVTESIPEPTAVVVEENPTPTPEPAAAPESATIIRPSEPARPKTLVERWMEIYPDTYNIKFGRPGKKFETWRSEYNTIPDANGNIVPNKIGLGGNTFTLTESGGRPMISGEISPGDLYDRAREYVYNPKWYSIADQGADPNLGKVRKWFWKPAENLNAKVRTNSGDITITGPGVSRTKLSNWLLGGAGLGAVGIGVPTIWGGIQSLFGGSGSDQPQRVIIDTNGTQYPFNSTPLSEDTLTAYINNKWVSIHPTGDGNFRIIPTEDAMEIDTYNAEQKAANQNSGPKTINKEESDTIFAE